MARRPTARPRVPYTTLFRSNAQPEQENPRAGESQSSEHPAGVVPVMRGQYPGGRPIDQVEEPAVVIHGEPVHQPAHQRSEEHTSELQSLTNLVCRLLLAKQQ